MSEALADRLGVDAGIEEEAGRRVAQDVQPAGCGEFGGFDERGKVAFAEVVRVERGADFGGKEERVERQLGSLLCCEFALHTAQLVGKVALHGQGVAQLGAQRDDPARVGRFQIMVVVMPGVPFAAFPAEGALDGEFAALPVDVRLEECQRFLGAESGFKGEAKQRRVFAGGADR